MSSWRACCLAARSPSPAPSIRTSSPTIASPPSSVTRGRGRARAGVLGDREVPGGERRHLRQVRDAQQLAPGGQVAQVLADRPRGVPADARRRSRRTRAAARRFAGRRRRPRPWATLSSASITRDSSPPEAISRSGPAGTPGLAAIISSTVSAPRGPQPSSRGRSSTSKRRVGHRELGQPRADRRRELGRGVPRGAQHSSAASRSSSARAWSSSSSPPSSATSACSSSLAPRAAALGVGRAPRRSSRRAFAAAARTEPGAPRPASRRRRAAGLADDLALEPGHVGAQLPPEILGLVAQRLQRARTAPPAAGRSPPPPSSSRLGLAPAAPRPLPRRRARPRPRRPTAASRSVSR